MPQHPPKLFSIITITYNAEQHLEGTLRSVIGQTCIDYEYLIIDGGSTDGTLDIAKSHEDHIDLLVSEPDKGLYDAMNKGLRAARGTYLCFLNAGDHLRDPNVLADLKRLAATEVDVLYGETMIVREDRSEVGTFSETRPHNNLPDHLSYRDMRHGMVVCHQAFLPRRTLAPEYELGNLAADIDWIIECLKRSRKTVNAQRILIDFLEGGISVQQHRKSLWGRYEVLKKHFGWLPNLAAHGWIVLRAALFRMRNRS